MLPVVSDWGLCLQWGVEDAPLYPGHSLVWNRLLRTTLRFSGCLLNHLLCLLQPCRPFSEHTLLSRAGSAPYSALSLQKKEGGLEQLLIAWLPERIFSVFFCFIFYICRIFFCPAVFPLSKKAARVGSSILAQHLCSPPVWMCRTGFVPFTVRKWWGYAPLGQAIIKMLGLGLIIPTGLVALKI